MLTWESKEVIPGLQVPIGLIDPIFRSYTAPYGAALADIFFKQRGTTLSVGGSLHRYTCFTSGLLPSGFQKLHLKLILPVDKQQLSELHFRTLRRSILLILHLVRMSLTLAGQTSSSSIDYKSKSWNKFF